MICEDPEPRVQRAAAVGEGAGRHVEGVGRRTCGDGLIDDHLTGVGEVAVFIEIDVADEPTGARYINRDAAAVDAVGPRVVEGHPVFVGAIAEGQHVRGAVEFGVGNAAEVEGRARVHDVAGAIRAALQGCAVGLGQVAVVVAQGRHEGEVEVRHIAAYVHDLIGRGRGAAARRRDHARRGCVARDRAQMQVGGRSADGDQQPPGRDVREGVVAGCAGRRGADLHRLARLEHIVAVIVPQIEVNGDAVEGDFIAPDAGRAAAADAVRRRPVEAKCAAELMRAAIAKPEVGIEVARRAGAPAQARDVAAGDHDRRLVIERDVRVADLGHTGREVRVARVDRHGVCAVRQVAETVQAVAVRLGGAGRAARAGQRDRDVRDAGLAGIAQPVAIRVEPDGVAERARRLVAEVGAHEARARVDDRGGLAVAEQARAGARARNTVGVRVGGEGRVAGDRADDDHVGVSAQAGEQVLTVGIGGRACRKGVCAGVVVAVGVDVDVQRDRSAADAGLGRILRAVGVRVPEDRVADGAEGREAEVGGERRRAAAAQRAIDAGGRRRDVAVAESVARQVRVVRVDDHAIGTVGQTRKQIAARRVGRRGRDLDVAPVAVEIGPQLDRDRHDAGLAHTALRAVAVDVIEDRVADLARTGRVIAEVLSEHGRGSRQHDDALAVADHARARLVRVAALGGRGRELRIAGVDDHPEGAGREVVEQIRAARAGALRRDDGIGAEVEQAIAIDVLVKRD